MIDPLTKLCVYDVELSLNGHYRIFWIITDHIRQTGSDSSTEEDF